MKSVGSLKEVALAAGDLVGLEGKLLSDAVVHSCEIDGLCASSPFDYLSGNFEGKSCFYFLCESVKAL